MPSVVDDCNATPTHQYWDNYLLTSSERPIFSRTKSQTRR